MAEHLEPIPMIVGPTASGKTARAVALALEVGGEVISADSRQVYRELRIGTARPTEEEMQGVPHHFVGDRSLTAPITAGGFAREAEACIAEIRARGRVPIVAGGSTLYLKALRDGLADLPLPDPVARAALDARLAAEGLPALVADLAHRDPEAIRTVDVQNPARVLRALEIVEATGLPLAEAHRSAAVPPRFSYRVTVLAPPPEELKRRIKARVLDMDQAGLRGEVMAVLAAGFDPTLPVLRTIGYAEVIAHLHGGPEWPATLAAIEQHTRQYARRQRTYFRKYFGLQ